MERLLTAIIIFLLLSASVPTSAQATTTCYTDHIDSVDVMTLGPLAQVQGWRPGLTSVALRETVLALDGRHTWVRSDDYGYFAPKTTRWEAVLIVHFGQRTNWLWIGTADDPNLHQLYWFPTMDEYTDARGEHMGEHPICGWNAIEVDKATIDNLLRLAGL